MNSQISPMASRSTKHQKVQGFTLVELLVVVAIIAILAAVGIPAYNGYQVSSRAQAAEDQFNAVHSFLSAEAKRCSTSKTIRLLDGTGTKTFTGGLTGTVSATDRNYLCRSALTAAQIVNHFADSSVQMEDVYEDGQAVLAATASPAAAPIDLGNIVIDVADFAGIQNGSDTSSATCPLEPRRPGWSFLLDANERLSSSPDILNQTALFTTYTPGAVGLACRGFGSSTFRELDISCGTPFQVQGLGEGVARKVNIVGGRVVIAITSPETSVVRQSLDPGDVWERVGGVVTGVPSDPGGGEVRIELWQQVIQ